MKRRIMVVDDEAMELKVFEKIINDNFIQVDFFGCSGGKEALDLFQKELPQIVFMDIELPGMDGLEITKRLVEINPSVKIIIHSAYSNFEYAQRAIRVGAVDYLLKPTKIENILAAIQKMLKLVEKEESENENKEQMESQLRRLEPVVKKTIVLNIVNNSVENIEEECGPLIWKRLQEGNCLVIKVNAQEQRERVMECILERLHREPDCFAHRFEDSKIMAVIGNGNKLTKLGFEEGVQWLTERLRVCADRTVRIYIGMGDYFVSQTGIQESYLQALERLQKCLQEEGEQENIDKGKLAGLLMKRGENTEWISSFFEQIFLRQKGNVAAISAELIEDFYYLKNYFMKQYQLDINISPMIQKMNGITQVQLLLKWLEEAAEKIHKEVQRKNIPQFSGIVLETIQCMEKEYSKDLNLNYIAEKVHVNPYYLSRIFKKETGRNLIQYLSEIRIREAVRLLKTTDIPIGEIAERTGFSSPAYFSKVFKEKMGCSARDYKEFYCL